MSKSIACAVLWVLSVSVVGWANDLQTGNWKVNLAKSHFKSSPAPQTQTVSVVPDGKDGVKVRVNAVNAKGEKSTIEYAAQYDGKEYPRTETGAGAIAGQTVTLRRINNRAAERITYFNGKKLVSEKWEISTDGKIRTVTQSGVGPDGKPVDNVLVYDKQ